MLSKINLFTLPYAGGNKYAFNTFDTYLKDDFEIYKLELAGRGKRISENLMHNIYLVVDDLFHQVKDKLDSKYIIYGHSLGGLLAYLLTLRIEEEGLNSPYKLIISGRANPSMKPSHIKHNLKKDDFITALHNLGGMPKTFFNHPELFDFFEPILRADFKIIEEFDFKENRKINSKISVLYGSDESFSKEQALQWQEFTNQKIDLKVFKGGHFFIFHHVEDVCNSIKNS